MGNVTEYHIDKAITDLIFEFVHNNAVEMSEQMVFDSFGADSNYIQIVNEHQIKALRGCSNGGGRRESIRMKLAMPTAKINEMGATSYHALGVVSNRTTQLIHAYSGLKDCHGVMTTNSSGYAYKAGKQVSDSGYTPLTKNMSRGEWKIKVTYLVDESKLQFERVDDGAIPKYEMDLPTNVQDITHWHPFISMRDANDIWTIENIEI